MDDNSDAEGIDILNDLLSNDTEENEQPAAKGTLKELDFNFLDRTTDELEKGNFSEESSTKKGKVTSEIYNKDVDSSDDEDKRYFQEQRYSDCGRDLKHLLKEQDSGKKENFKDTSAAATPKFSLNFKSNKKRVSNVKEPTKQTKLNFASTTPKDVYSDAFFGLRIINPLISSAELKERMNGRNAVTVSRVKDHLASGKVDSDWVIAGVLINTSTPRTSQKGTSYCIWKISDLSENIKTISLFLFSGAYKTFWKTSMGSVIGVLNPNIMESKDNIDQATLSVDNAQKLMILGTSKDMGKCKSVKKNGDPCTSIVNLNRCEYCVYHIKQEYKKASLRADLQSMNNTQRFLADNFKKKSQHQVPRGQLPGMEPFVPVYAKRNEKLYQKDRERLALLSGMPSDNLKQQHTDVDEPKKNKGKSVELTSQQMKKDFERLNKLRGWRNGTPVITSPSQNVETSQSPSVIPNGSPAIKEKQSNGLSDLSRSSSSPRLGVGCSNGKIDFTEPITKKHITLAKMNAIRWVQQNGKINASNPNKAGPTKTERIDRIDKIRKRQRENEELEAQPTKKSNALSDKFKEMLEAKSSHTDLIEKSYDEEKEKYFNKLEAKERMEEKMMTTFKVECKAVKCLICKYTAFSASDTCKEQKHPLRIMNAIKRFFKCSDCGNRTVSLNRMPSHSCAKCSSSSWVRAAMMDEKKVKMPSATLSVRGDEETFIGSATKDANLNLLVPESD